MKDANSPILVTGATGFIGGRLVERLLRDGCAVRILALPGEAIEARWEHALEIVRGDIANAAAVRRAVEGTKLVYHLAAVVGDWADWRVYEPVTVEGTRHIYSAALAQDTQVVLASSAVIYGHYLVDQVCAEDQPFGKPQGNYSRAKQQQERDGHAYTARGLKLTMIRPGNVIGAGCRPWVRDLVREIRRKTPALIDGGKGNAGLIHVDNLVDLFVRAALPAAIGRAYNACDEWAVTWAQYMTDIAEVIGMETPASIARPLATITAYGGEALWWLTGNTTRPPLTREALNLVGANIRMSTTRARTELGWQPTVTYAQAMAEIGNYIRTQRL
ncbi:MAG: NAD-dependent epimerase/dehydratase family protein [Chloroflexota bacterium]|nr:NAD-dependent epimerase/dehydratase family protein [Chloroflexota bacterium]